ncbi:MAG: hypothetical protein HKN14_05530 [Marinicaulis sp.]|nr:hypothetical protein [Marinicaulis sp.]NNE40364.1 hypothetical protein [Marinicaulis sp.]NNL88079.1 hypothetical protein [Marinicaulis sp.]
MKWMIVINVLTVLAAFAAATFFIFDELQSRIIFFGFLMAVTGGGIVAGYLLFKKGEANEERSKSNAGD